MSAPDPVEARIVSDGTPQGTTVHVGDHQLTNVQHVAWELDVSDQYAVATITLGLVEVDLRGRSNLRPGPTPRQP